MIEIKMMLNFDDRNFSKLTWRLFQAGDVISTGSAINDRLTGSIKGQQLKWGEKNKCFIMNNFVVILRSKYQHEICSTITPYSYIPYVPYLIVTITPNSSSFTTQKGVYVGVTLFGQLYTFMACTYTCNYKVLGAYLIKFCHSMKLHMIGCVSLQKASKEIKGMY